MTKGFLKNTRRDLIKVVCADSGTLLGWFTGRLPENRREIRFPVPLELAHVESHKATCCNRTVWAEVRVEHWSTQSEEFRREYLVMKEDDFAALEEDNDQ